MLNIITAKFCNNKKSAWTDEQWQWDYGQILQFEGLELPQAYEVHFSNIAIGGESITQIGGENGVTIPDQFFVSGETIYAWVYLHQGEDDGETEYSVTVPIKKRPQPSDTPPTPQEQSAIDQAIAALNVAVEKAEDAIEHYPHIQSGTWWVWDVTTETWVDTQVEAQGPKGNKGDDGYSPTVTVTDITDGHRVTITDKTGAHVFDIMDGEKGDAGVSPSVTVTDITGGHRVKITDEVGDHTFDVMNGTKGDTGNGIASIAKTGTVGLVDTYTITYTNGQTTTFTVTNGSDATVTVDDALSDESENPVQNKVITGKIGDLKADINQLEDILSDSGTVTGTEWDIKARFEQNGLLNQNNNWRMFKYAINDTDYSTITVHTGMQSRGSITIPMVAFYKKTVSEITASTWTSLTTADVAGTGTIYPTGAAQECTETLEVPEGTKSCFVCIGVDYYNNGMRPSVTYSNTIDLDTLETTANSAYELAQKNESDIDDIEENLTVANQISSEYVMTCRFNQDGTLEWNASWRMYKFDITDISKVTVHTAMQSRGSITIPMIVFFNKEASTITDATWNTLTTSDVVGMGTVYPTGAAQETTEVLTVPSGAKSMLVSIGIDYYNLGMLPTATYENFVDITSLLNVLDTNYQYAVDKVLCIGDSLTQGAYFGNKWPGKPSDGTPIAECYPNYLSRMLSCSVTNGGAGGYTASDWYNNQLGNFTLSDYNTFIVWLGTNNGLSGQLGADYEAIIDAIQTAKPDSLVVLMTIFAGGGSDVAGTNATILSVAEDKDCLVIDMSDLSPSRHPELHGMIDNPHFTKAGNVFVADRVCNELKNMFNDNPSLTEFGMSQGVQNAIYEH